MSIQENSDDDECEMACIEYDQVIEGTLIDQRDSGGDGEGRMIAT